MKITIVIAGAALMFMGCVKPDSQATMSEQQDSTMQSDVMKIRLQRSGGIAGMMVDVEIDGDSLTASERDTLSALITDAQFFSLPTKATDEPPRGADRFNYRITIEAGGRRHTVETTDGAAPASLIPLLDWLNGAARRARRSGNA